VAEAEGVRASAPRPSERLEGGKRGAQVHPLWRPQRQRRGVHHLRRPWKSSESRKCQAIFVVEPDHRSDGGRSSARDRRRSTRHARLGFVIRASCRRSSACSVPCHPACSGKKSIRRDFRLDARASGSWTTQSPVLGAAPRRAVRQRQAMCRPTRCAGWDAQEMPINALTVLLPVGCPVSRQCARRGARRTTARWPADDRCAVQAASTAGEV